MVTVHRYHISLDGHLVLNMDVKHEILASTINVKITLADPPCLQQRLQGQTIPFDARAHQDTRIELYEARGDLDPATALFVSVFYDKYTSAPTRYKSTGGLYLTISSMTMKEQKKLDSVHLLSLVPSGADFRVVWERYRLELVHLEKQGFNVTRHTATAPTPTTTTTCHKVRLSTFKADSPQRSESLDHVSGSADLFSPKDLTRKADLWNVDLDFHQTRFHPGFIEAIHNLKEQLTPEEFPQVKAKYGFHGEFAMFSGLTFDPFTQVSSEPHHLLNLGLMKFFFKRTLATLKPFQRDQANFIVQDFSFCRGLHGITFDISGKWRNFSISLMQQISLPFLFALNLLDVAAPLVRFWGELDSFVRAVFQPLQLKSKLLEIQQKGKWLLTEAKRLMPKVTEKRPHNIHSFLEFLLVDLPAFVLGVFLSGSAEEHKHQPFKQGGHFTSGGSATSSQQLVSRDVLVSTLRYLLHGGALQDGYTLHPSLRNAKDPVNPDAPHPVLLPFTTSAIIRGIEPKSFSYVKGKRVVRELTADEKPNLSTLSGIPVEALRHVHPCRKFAIDERMFGVGDHVSILHEE